MGCVSSGIATNKSKTKPENFKVSNNVRKQNGLESAEETCPELSEKDKELIKTSWEFAVEDISKIGVIAFTSLFETHPSVQDVFISFRDLNLEELKLSGELRSHALNVTNFVQKVISRLNEPDKAVALLQEVGKRHVAHGAPSNYLRHVGPQFIKALKPSIGDNWNDDVERSWLLLFDFIVFHMKCAMDT